LSVSTKSASGPSRGLVRRFGQHHRQFRAALAVLAGVGRLVVDCRVDELDEGFEQHLELADQLPVGQRDGGLRGERFGEALVGFGKRHDDLVGRHVALISCRTPMISPSWLRIGTVRKDCDR
jgi:hypothetical protein